MRELSRFDHVWAGLFSIQLVDVSSEVSLLKTAERPSVRYDQFGFEQNAEEHWRSVAISVQKHLNARATKFECKLVLEDIEIQCKVQRRKNVAIVFELELPGSTFCVGYAGQTDCEYRSFVNAKFEAFNDALDRVEQQTGLTLFRTWFPDADNGVTMWYGPKVTKKNASVLAQLMGSIFFGWCESR